MTNGLDPQFWVGVISIVLTLAAGFGAVYFRQDGLLRSLVTLMHGIDKRLTAMETTVALQGKQLSLMQQQNQKLDRVLELIQERGD